MTSLDGTVGEGDSASGCTVRSGILAIMGGRLPEEFFVATTLSQKKTVSPSAATKPCSPTRVMSGRVPGVGSDQLRSLDQGSVVVTVVDHLRRVEPITQ